MVFYITSVDSLGEERDFQYQIDQIDAGLDVLSCLVAQGNRLLTVRLADEGSYTTLSAESFDGTPVSITLQELEKQWHSLLDEPIAVSSLNPEPYIDLVRQLVELYELRVTHQEVMLTKLNWLVQTTEGSKLSAVTKVSLIDKYTVAIRGYERTLINTRANHKNVLDSISQLTANHSSQCI